MSVSPFHDSSVALYCDGKIEYFIKEERLSRIKRDKHPYLAVEQALENSKGPIDLAVICSPDHEDPTIFAWKKYLEKKVKVDVIDLSSQHHLQHASLAFYNSGFEKSLVVIIDRNGTRYGEYRESETVYIAEYPCKFKPIIKNLWRETDSITASIRDEIINGFDNCKINLNSRYGIVKVYETATSLIGQHALENGKTMGLAAYGKNTNYPQLFHDGFIPNDYLFSHQFIQEELAAINKNLHLQTIDKISETDYQLYADYALHVQQETEKAVEDLIKKSIEISGISNICLSGGYALNVVSNGKLVKKFPECNFYFEPLADDSGNSLGGAMLIYRDRTADHTIHQIQDTFFSGVTHDITIQGTECTVEDIVNFIILQKSVGIFQGKSEAGPRALGHRSILFDARNPNAKKIVNKIKQREWYRPFACIILEEDLEKYFDCKNNFSNKFMTSSYKIKDEMTSLIPGVIHIDGSCRVQVITPLDGVIYDMLCTFKNKTGIPVLLNTSLNLAGYPLVETPAEAVDVLNNSELDLIYFPEKNIYVN